jgi:hypothetical protein
MNRPFITLCLVVLLLPIMACDDNLKVNPDGFTELTVDLNGTWKIDQVLQNGLDITDALDFKSFALDLNYDGNRPSSFSLTGKSPFVTSTAAGSWSFDDPTYPTAIIFSDGTSASIINPVLTSGANVLDLSIVMGCDNNMYQYKLSK